MCVSVVMATYNGEKYLKQQLLSIVTQLKNEDEIIISDDGSTDNTKQIIMEAKKEHANIVLVAGPQKGIASNFENAIRYAKNDLILFSDQDDIWDQRKIEEIKNVFYSCPNTNVIMHNAGYIDSEGSVLSSDIFTDRATKHGFLRNIIRSTYYGCCMAFRKEFLMEYFHEAEKMLAYDQYLGLCAEWRRESQFLNKKLIYHRVHDGNESHELSLANKVRFRLHVLQDFYTYRK